MLPVIMLVIMGAIVFCPVTAAMQITQIPSAKKQNPADILPSFSVAVNLLPFMTARLTGWRVNIFNKTFFAADIVNSPKRKIAVPNGFNWVKVLKHISVRRVKIEMAFGTGTAASTCLIVGGISAALNMFFLRQGRRFSSIPPPPYLFIKPVFDRPALHIQAECIASMTLGNIIIIIFKLLFTKILTKIKEDVMNGRRQRRNKTFDRNIYE